MNLHLACVGMMFETYGDELSDRFLNPKPRFSELRSYYEWFKFSGHTLPIKGRPFFLDSGAYSAYSMGRPITVEEYAEFLLKYGEQCDVYANLDAIPQRDADGHATPKALQLAAEESFANQQYLESRGLKPLPVYHLGEPLSYLEYYKSNYEYFCCGGLVDIGKLNDYFDELWGVHLTDGSGNPTNKVHGFGMTSVRNMTEFPWYSVDSSTWLIHCKLGIISFPRKKIEGGWDFKHRPTLVGISDRSVMREYDCQHYDNMTSEQRKGIEEYVAEFGGGVTIQELQGHPVKRMLINIEYWIRVEQENRQPKTFATSQIDLF